MDKRQKQKNHTPRQYQKPETHYSREDLYRTKMCRASENGNECPFEATCRYAHSLAELRSLKSKEDESHVRDPDRRDHPGGDNDHRRSDRNNNRQGWYEREDRHYDNRDDRRQQDERDDRHGRHERNYDDHRYDEHDDRSHAHSFREREHRPHQTEEKKNPYHQAMKLERQALKAEASEDRRQGHEKPHTATAPITLSALESELLHNVVNPPTNKVTVTKSPPSVSQGLPPGKPFFTPDNAAPPNKATVVTSPPLVSQELPPGKPFFTLEHLPPQLLDPSSNASAQPATVVEPNRRSSTSPEVNPVTAQPPTMTFLQPGQQPPAAQQSTLGHVPQPIYIQQTIPQPGQHVPRNPPQYHLPGQQPMMMMQQPGQQPMMMQYPGQQPMMMMQQPDQQPMMMMMQQPGQQPMMMMQQPGHQPMMMMQQPGHQPMMMMMQQPGQQPMMMMMQQPGHQPMMMMQQPGQQPMMMMQQPGQQGMMQYPAPQMNPIVYSKPYHAPTSPFQTQVSNAKLAHPVTPPLLPHLRPTNPNDSLTKLDGVDDLTTKVAETAVPPPQEAEIPPSFEGVDSD